MKEKRIPSYLGGVKATLALGALLIFGLVMVPLSWQGIAEARDAVKEVLMIAFGAYFIGKVLDK